MDCLPLAVELAATQVRTLGIETLRERLSKRVALLADGPRDLPARQRTLHDTLAWSTDLLSPEERTQFARLGVFSGGGNAEAALAVSGGTAESLPALADHSLLRVSDESGEMRFSMLETVRDHALELLAGSAAWDEARNAHAEHFASLIERTDPRGEETKRLRLIDLDLDNFRAAMDWFEHNGQDAAALRLATGLYHYWYLRGLLREGRGRLGGPLGRGAGSPALRALALRALAGIDLVFGDNDSAEERARAGIATGTEAGTLEPVMGCETVLGLAALGRGRLDEARTHIARSGALARELGLEADVVIADTNLAEISFRAGDLDDARRRWESVLAWHEHGSAPESGVFALLGLAAIAHAEDRLDEAERLFERARHLADTAGFTQLAGHAHIGLAAVAAKRGDHVEAANRLGRADAMFDEFGGRSAEFDPALASEHGGERPRGARRERLHDRVRGRASAGHRAATHQAKPKLSLREQQFDAGVCSGSSGYPGWRFAALEIDDLRREETMRVALLASIAAAFAVSVAVRGASDPDPVYVCAHLQDGQGAQGGPLLRPGYRVSAHRRQVIQLQARHVHLVRRHPDPRPRHPGQRRPCLGKQRGSAAVPTNGRRSERPPSTPSPGGSTSV